VPRRDLTRRAHDAAQLTNMAKITASDVEHAAATWREDAPAAWRGRLDGLPAYEGDGVPSDDVRADP
jgi:hypothetical protein